MAYRLLGLILVWPSTYMWSSKCPALNGRAWLIRLREFPPSKDLLLGRSKTRNDGSGGFSSSSKAFPEDFRRPRLLGILIGIKAFKFSTLQDLAHAREVDVSWVGWCGAQCGYSMCCRTGEGMQAEIADDCFSLTMFPRVNGFLLV